MPSSQQSARVSQAPSTRPYDGSRRKKWLRWIVVLMIACTLSLLAGLLTYRECLRARQISPHYVINVTPTPSCSTKTVGPWILSTSNNHEARVVHVEARYVKDGQLLAKYTFPMGEAPSFPSDVLDHQKLGVDTVLGYDVFSQKITLFQPRTGECQILTSFSTSNPGHFYLAADKASMLECRCLQLSPLALLGITGLPDILAADFQSYLGHPWDGLHSVPLVRLRDTRTGLILGAYSLPDIVGTWVRLHFLNNEHFLETHTPISGPLGKYFRYKPNQNPVEENPFRASLTGVTMRDAVSGRVVWRAGGAAYFNTWFGSRLAVLYSQEDPRLMWPDLSDEKREGIIYKRWLFRTEGPTLTELVGDSVRGLPTLGPHGEIRYIDYDLMGKGRKARWWDYNPSGVFVGHSELSIPPEANIHYTGVSGVLIAIPNPPEAEDTRGVIQTIWEEFCDWAAFGQDSLIRVWNTIDKTTYSLCRTVPLQKEDNVDFDADRGLLIVRSYDHESRLFAISAYQSVTPRPWGLPWLPSVVAIACGFVMFVVTLLLASVLKRKLQEKAQVP